MESKIQTEIVKYLESKKYYVVKIIKANKVKFNLVFGILPYYLGGIYGVG